MRFLQRLFGDKGYRPPNPDIIKRTAQIQEEALAKLKTTAMESGNTELLRVIKRQENDLAMLKAEADLLSIEDDRKPR